MADPVERRQVAVLLVVVAATGVVDAASLLHLGTFTAYVTGALVVLGAHLVGDGGSPVPAAVAVAAFVAGALVGSRLARRLSPQRRRITVILAVDAALVACATAVAIVAGIGDRSGAYATIAFLGLAMGCQTAAVRSAGVAGVALPAATGVTYDLVSDSPLAGGRPRITGRRVGVVAALVGGAVAGAGAARWEPWAAWALAAAVVATAAVLAHVTLAPRRPGVDDLTSN